MADDPVSRLRRFLSELKRRRVYRVAAGYLVAAFVVLQVADLAAGAFELPDSFEPTVWVLCGLGFPLAVALAWIFDITPDGVRRVSTGRAWPWGIKGPAILVGTGLTVGLVGWLLLGRGGGRAPVEVEGRRVAVLPFEVRAGPDLQYLGEAFVDLLSAKLNGAGELTSVDPAALLAALPSDSSASFDPDRARDVAGGFGAGHFILGSLTRLGDELEVQARLYGGDAQAVATAVVTTPEVRLAEAVDELARGLLAGMLDGRSAGLTEVAATATGSLPALKAYLRGEAALRRGSAAMSVEHFERAVTLDSGFTWAWYRLGVARSWMPRASAAYAATADAITAALAGIEGVPERERTLIRLFDAYWRGSGVVAERLAWEILSAQPEHLEARYFLGEAVFHNATAQGRSRQEAREHFERVLALQPEHAFALVHLVDLALARRDEVGLDTLGTRLADLATSLAPQVRAYGALLSRPEDPVPALRQALVDVPAQDVVDIAWRATAQLAEPWVAAAFGRTLEELTSGRAAEEEITAMLAGAAAAEGEWERAMELLGPYLGSRAGAAAGAQLILAGGAEAPRQELAGLLPTLLRPGTGPEEQSAADEALPTVIRSYLAGRIALLEGRPDDHAVAVERLEALEDSVEASPGLENEDPRSLPSYYLVALGAHEAALEGDIQRAVELLRRPDMALLADPEVALMARVLAARGAVEEAGEWREALPDFDPRVYRFLPLLSQDDSAP